MKNKNKNLIFMCIGSVMTLVGLGMFITGGSNDVPVDPWFIFAFAGICTGGIAAINLDLS